MSRSSFFQVSAEASSCNQWYHVGCNDPFTPVQWQSVDCGCIPLETGETRFDNWSNRVGQILTRFDCWSNRVPTKLPRSSPEGSTDYIICPLHVICHHFLAIKTLVLRVASSLWADIDLVGTNLEDRDSFLDNSFANISLRVHFAQISWVFVWFIIP